MLFCNVTAPLLISSAKSWSASATQFFILVMKLNSTIIATAIAFSASFHAPSAHALPNEICEIRAALIGSVAQERDKGTSKKKVMAITLKSLGPNAKGFSGYVDLVYANPKLTPDELYKLALFSCQRE